MQVYKDRYYNFIELFNEKNGFLIRTNILDENGNETNIKPLCRSYPELIDIGIVGSCQNGRTCHMFGIKCYQKDSIKPDMKLSDYKRIIDESANKTFQVALGGRGDPNKHKDFIEILKYTREKGIVPNLTSSGYNMTDEEAEAIIEYCGSVAISMYSKVVGGKESNPDTIKAINRFADRIHTNVHYVISNNTIDDAIYRLENDCFPSNIHGVIFLLYKPVGLAADDRDNLIRFNNPKIEKFLDLVFLKKHQYKIGFDTCFSYLLFQYNPSLKDNPSVQSCESGTFSCYIDSDLTLYPCSFTKEKEYEDKLGKEGIEYIWNRSKKIALFRNNKKCGMQCSVCYLNKHL